MREAYRRLAPRLPRDIDIVLVPRRAAAGADLFAVATELAELVTRALTERRRSTRPPRKRRKSRR